MRSSHIRFLCATTAAAAAVVLGFGGPDAPASAESTKAAALTRICEEDHAYHRRALALKELAELGTSDARKALESLAGSKDRSLAIQAAAALGREGSPEARTKLKSIFEDSKCDQNLRAAAAAAWTAASKKAGSSEQDAKSGAEAKCKDDACVKDAAAAARAKSWSKSTTGSGK